MKGEKKKIVYKCEDIFIIHACMYTYTKYKCVRVRARVSFLVTI